MNENNVRALAARVLARLDGESGSLTTLLSQRRDHPEFPLLQELCYGCCRWYFLLDALLAQLVSRPIKNKDHDLRCLLICGLYQLRELAIPEYAAINETVAAAKVLGKPWATGLVNGVLRNYVRQQQALDAALDESTRLAHPEWLTARLQQAWPEHWSNILKHNNQRPPMTLRVNLAKLSRDDYLEKLKLAGIAASAGAHSPSAIYLQTPQETTSLPGFAEGLASVQDESSQLAAPLLDAQPAMRVLDACAAPGGKTCHILEGMYSLTNQSATSNAGDDHRTPENASPSSANQSATGNADGSRRTPEGAASSSATLLALDKDSRRLEKIQSNLARLQLQAKVVCADASDPDSWWDGQPFDRILLDAPCSASGVIRRHPDIKLLLDEAAVSRQAAAQQALLRALWPCLKPGGRLLYTTCSVLPEENSEQIKQFLAGEASAKHSPITADWGVEWEFGRALAPGGSESYGNGGNDGNDKSPESSGTSNNRSNSHNGPDGFYYCILEKCMLEKQGQESCK
ncbi:MAG: 16S rRNA (cytosine(967)-C(5))-methyltransferase [Pseudohongiellaceae bacterium]